jgi:segregation and condensation protein B
MNQSKPSGVVEVIEDGGASIDADAPLREVKGKAIAGVSVAAVSRDAEEVGNTAVGEEEIASRVEAVLMTTDRPLTTGKLAEVVGGVAGKMVSEAVRKLNQVYEETQRSFRVESVAGGWQVMTLPRFAEVLSVLHRARAATKLSAAAMETLAIVAYRQPILRAEIEAIRGVSSGEVIRSLMDKHLVKIVGRAEELGRPMLYGTTRVFLETFGLTGLKDLPKVDELKPRA